MRKGQWALLFVFISAFALIPICGHGTDAVVDSNIKFSEVNPFGNDEGFSLHNCGTESFDLKGCTVSDGEGTISFTEHIYINADSRKTFVKSKGESPFSQRDDTYVIGTGGTEKKGSFILSNTGDDLYLKRGENIIDAVCYGNKMADEGWFGDPVPISSNRYILRIDLQDTDSSADWILTKAGLSHFKFDPSNTYDAMVTPFSFPESKGSPILKAVSETEYEILISMYLLTSVDLVSVLYHKLCSEEIVVRILLEGYVLGQDITEELKLMRSLADVGAEVYLINDRLPGNYERFSFFHNKYAIIDGEKIIITSENWTNTNISENCSNRGWGAIIESTDLAIFMREVFSNDVDTSFGDVRELTDCYPDIKPYQSPFVSTEAIEYDMIRAHSKVIPVLSPDNSYGALKYFMENATERIYSQQMDLGTSFRMIAEPSPLQWMADASKKDVDVRFILDSSIYSSQTAMEEAVNMINSTSNIKAIAKNGGDGYALIHNKGVIADDAVWIGSVNWTENSFMNNREIAMIIVSEETVAFFADLFEKDWGINEHTVAEEGLEITHSVLEVQGRNMLLFAVSGPEDAEYRWDLYGNGDYRTSFTNRIICSDLLPGEHRLTVTMAGTEHTADIIYSVAEESDGEGSENVGLLASVALMISGLFLSFRRRNNNNRSKPIRYDDPKTNEFIRR